MEMTFRKIRIRNYVRSSLLRTERRAAELFISKYNPFYNWRVGNLEGEQIKEALNYFNANNELPESIRKSIANAKAFALLLNFYKDKTEGNEKAKLTIMDWLSIREKYETEIKKEYETNFGKIGFNENIEYDKSKKGKSNSDSDDAFDSEKHNTSSSDEAHTEEELEEAALTEITRDEIESLLDEMHQGNWVVKIIPESKNNFNHRIAILNLHLAAENKNEILNDALNRVKTYFTKSNEGYLLEMKSIGSNNFIEGYFTGEN